MPEFQRVQAPIKSPTMCLTCSTHKDPNGFVDIMLDPFSTRFPTYICASCVYQAGQKLGMLSPDQANSLLDRLKAGQKTITQLSAELQAEKLNKFISVSDINQYIGGYVGSNSSTTVKVPKSPGAA